MWYGQNKNEQYNGQDFVALAIVEGFLEFAFRLNSEETLIKNVYSRVDDGVRHVAIIKRTGNQASLELDGLSLHGESRPTNKKESYMPGNTFLGKKKKFSFCNENKLMPIFFTKIRWRTGFGQFYWKPILTRIPRLYTHC